MTDPSIARAIGQIEGGQKAMNDRLEALEKLLGTISTDLAAIKESEAKRKGERGVLLWLVGIVGGGIGSVISIVLAKIFH